MGISWDRINELAEERAKDRTKMEEGIGDLYGLVEDAYKRDEITTDQRMELLTDVYVMSERAADIGAERAKELIEAHIEKTTSEADSERDAEDKEFESEAKKSGMGKRV